MPKPQTKEEIAKETCFVIGNGESRLIWRDWNKLKGKGTIYLLPLILKILVLES